MNRMHMLLAVLMMGVMGMVFAACAPAAEEKTDGPPAFDMTLTHVEQWSEMAGQVPDGHYVVLTLKIKNQSNATQTLAPWDFEIQNITSNEAEQYSQPNEKVGNSFYTLYGPEKYKLLLDNAEQELHPRMDVVRYIVFQLPKDANLARYQMIYKPQELKFPLEGDNIELQDHRVDVPVEEEETAEEAQ